jgi:FixJ family two-component response regulator
VNATKVCLIDDDPSVQRAIRRLLQWAGYEVQLCSSAIEYLTMPQDSKLSCLLVDVRMPGMTGLELQAALKESRRDLPMVMMSGHADAAMIARAKAAGAVSFLCKPFEDVALLDAVELAVGRDRQRRARSLPLPVQSKM